MGQVSKDDILGKPIVCVSRVVCSFLPAAPGLNPEHTVFLGIELILWESYFDRVKEWNEIESNTKFCLQIFATTIIIKNARGKSVQNFDEYETLELIISLIILFRRKVTLLNNYFVN